MALGALLLATVLTVGVAVLVLINRPARLDLQLSKGEPVLLVVGLDDRSALPSGRNVYGRPDDVGARADVVLLVHQTSHGPQVISVPRGLVLSDGLGVTTIGSSWQKSPQNTVDAFCNFLNVGVTDVVAVNMRGFAATVDGLGGIDVTLPQTLRDSKAHVELPVGTQHVDGRTALALVRSRQAEVLIDGQWVTDSEGSAGRTRRAGEVFDATAKRAAHASWVTRFVAAWSAADDVSVSRSLDLFGLAGLASGSISHVDLPTGETSSSTLVNLTPETKAFIKESGLNPCSS